MLLNLITACFFFSTVTGSLQSIGVKGCLKCGSKPDVGTLVKLYDKDIGWDDKLAQGKTDSNGCFQLTGSTKEVSRIDPVLNIYTNCKDGIKPCKRKIKQEIPKSYITRGSIPSKIYDMGTLNLEAKFKGETRDCFH